jgi:hypothetical protein
MRLHNEASKLRQAKDAFKKLKSDFERLSALEAKLKGPERYKVLEEYGGSIGDWQGRALSGEEPNPQVSDLRKLIEERDKQWEQRIAEIKAERESERAQYAVETAEQTFATHLVEAATQHKHFQAAGAHAVDRCYDFAEFVARAMKGRKDIPRGEIPFVNEYLNKVPRAVALDPQNLAAYYDRRLAYEASVWAPRGQPEPQGQPAKPAPKPEPAKQGQSRQPPLDNATATQRGAPPPAKDPSKMTSKEFAAWSASQVEYSDDY